MGGDESLFVMVIFRVVVSSGESHGHQHVAARLELIESAPLADIRLCATVHST